MVFAAIISSVLAAHPTLTVRGSIAVTESRLQITLEESAARAMHLDDGAVEGVTLSRWIASSLDVRDRSGHEIRLEVCQDSDIVRVCAPPGTESFPVTVSYEPMPSGDVHPPARIVLAGESPVTAAVALVQGRGPVVVGHLPVEPELGARVTRVHAGEIEVSVCVPVSGLPAAAFPGGSIAGLALDEPSARRVESYVSATLAGMVPQDSHPPRVEMFVPGWNSNGAFPVNVHLAWIRATLSVRSDRADIELPLRDLGLLSLPVTVVNGSSRATRGLATLRDPRVRVGPDGTSVGREF